MNVSRETFGHNGGPSFDSVVEENLQRGLLLTIKDALVQATRDPRLERRHLRVLAEIVDCLNSNGVAFPGRRRLALLTADESRPQGYPESTIASTVADLARWGYIASARRQAVDGQRAVAHYTVRKPSIEDLQKQISAWVADQRRTPARRRWTPPATPAPKPNVDHVLNVNHAGNVNHVLNVTGPNVDHVLNVKGAADVDHVLNVTPPAKDPLFIEESESKQTTYSLGTLFPESAPPSSTPSTRGTRLPDDWTLPEGWRVAALKRGLSNEQIDAEATKFQCYWATKTGRGAAKRRWDLVWRQWIENAIGYGLRPNGLSVPRSASESAQDRRLRGIMGEAAYASYRAIQGQKEGTDV